MSEHIEWYLPLSYAAEMLGCRRHEVVSLIEQGVLDYIQMPQNRIKVSRKSVQNYIGISKHADEV
jgi:predicted site-specific integrase-resolvase